MTQITQKQHFVPKCYLKGFARDGKIQVLDVTARRVAKPRSYTSVCYKKFFYAAETGRQDEISQAFEEVFGQIEDQYSKALPAIIDRARATDLTNDDLARLAYFMSVQWLRTASFRDRVNKIQADLTKWVMKTRASMAGFEEHIRDTVKEHEVSDGDVRDVKQLLQSFEYDVRFDNSQHLRLIDKGNVNGFFNLLLAKRWRIILTEDPYRFITSDNPVAEWYPPRTGIFGSTFTARSHLLALTPHILIETPPSEILDRDQQPVDRLSYHNANGTGVFMLNKMLANGSHEYLYAQRTAELDQLLGELNRFEPNSKS